LHEEKKAGGDGEISLLPSDRLLVLADLRTFSDILLADPLLSLFYSSPIFTSFSPRVV
jgi:hypothetical protein